MCNVHPDKEIEFYWKDCNSLICSRWMFSDHNGHNLSLLQEAIKLFEKQIDLLFSDYKKLNSKDASQSESNCLSQFIT